MPKARGSASTPARQPRCCSTHLLPGECSGTRGDGRSSVRWEGSTQPGRLGGTGQDLALSCAEPGRSPAPQQPDPSCIPHSCPFPSPRAGTDSACLFLPTETTALQIPPANATCPSPAAGEQGSQVQHPRPCTTPHPLLHFHPKPPQNPIIN